MTTAPEAVFTVRTNGDIRPPTGPPADRVAAGSVCSVGLAWVCSGIALGGVSFFLDPVDSEPAQIATGYVRDGRDYSVTWPYPDQPLRARLRIVAGNNVPGGIRAGRGTRWIGATRSSACAETPTVDTLANRLQAPGGTRRRGPDSRITPLQ